MITGKIRSQYQKIAALCLFLALAACSKSEEVSRPEVIAPPETQLELHSRTVLGVSVADPYAWMRGTQQRSSRIVQWLEAQGKYTDHFLSDHRFSAQLPEIRPFAYQSLYQINGAVYFLKQDRGNLTFARTEVLDAVLSRNAGFESLIDDNSAQQVVPDPTGQFIALHQMTESGTTVWKVYDVEEKRYLLDSVEIAPGQDVIWKVDGSGFYYLASSGSNSGKDLVKFHRKGTPERLDSRAFDGSKSNYVIEHFGQSVEGRFLIVIERNRLNGDRRATVKNIAVGNNIPLVPDRKGRLEFVASGNGQFFFVMKNEGRRDQLVQIDITQPLVRNWTILRNLDEGVIISARLFGEHIVLHTLKGLSSSLETFDLTGQNEGAFPIPDVGAITKLEGHPQSPVFYIHLETLDQNQKILEANSAQRSTAEIWVDTIGSKSDIQYKDVQLPEELSLFWREGAEGPVLLWVTDNVAQFLENDGIALLRNWADQGGVAALLKIPGGVSVTLGENNQLGISRSSVEAVFKAADLLEEDFPALTDKMAIAGSDMAATTVAAALNESPERFQAAYLIAGRYDFVAAGDGKGSTQAEQAAMKALSPYYQIDQNKAYPSLLMTPSTAEPGDTFRYIAAMQSGTGEGPYLLARRDEPVSDMKMYGFLWARAALGPVQREAPQ